MLKYKNQLLAVLLSVLLVSLSGCSDKLWVVECDSGFSTGLRMKAFVDDGVVMWKDNFDDRLTKRKMLPGEICTNKYQNQR